MLLLSKLANAVLPHPIGVCPKNIQYQALQMVGACFRNILSFQGDA